MNEFDKARELAAAQMNEPEQTVNPDTAPNAEEQAADVSSETIYGEETAATPEETQQPQTEVASEEQETLDNAVNTAEAATQAVQERSDELNRVIEEMQQLREQNAQLSETLQQMSRLQQERIVDDAVHEEPPCAPMLDIESMVFGGNDSEQTAQIQQQWAQQFADYVKQGVMQSLSPYLQSAKEGMIEKESHDVLTALASEPKLANIMDVKDDLDRIIAGTPALAAENIPVDEKYITAYAIKRGVDAMNAPQATEPTVQEIYEKYKDNPELQSLIERDRLARIKQNQQVPQMSVSAGLANAAPTIKEKPKTFSDSSTIARQLLGL